LPSSPTRTDTLSSLTTGECFLKVGFLVVGLIVHLGGEGGGGVGLLVGKLEFIREDLLLVSILFRNPDPKLFIPHLIPDPAK
jgi:hypothetical protein